MEEINTLAAIPVPGSPIGEPKFVGTAEGWMPVPKPVDIANIVNAEPVKFQPMSAKLIESINKGDAAIARRYLAAFGRSQMSTAELIGCYRKIIDSGEATDAEEMAFLDLLNPYHVSD